MDMGKIQTGLLSIIKLSERLFKTDMLYVAKSGFWLTFGQISASFLALGLSIVFAHYLPKEEYGNYKFILSIVGIVSALSLSGMGQVITQSVAQGKERTFFKAVETHLKWSGGILIILFGIGVYYILAKNYLLGFSFVFAGIMVPISNTYGLYGSLLTGRKDFKKSTSYWIISQTVISLSLATLAFFGENILLLISTHFLATTATSVFFYYRTIRKFPPQGETDPGMIKYGKHISAMNFFGTLANQLDKVLIFHYLGGAQLAIYSFAFAIPEQIKGSFKNLFGIALPKYASIPEDRLRKSIIDKTIRLTAVTFLIVIVYIIASPLIYKILFPKYIESVFYSQIYVLGLVTIPGISLISTYFQVKKDTVTLYKLTVIGNIATLALTYVLIYNFGLIGAVIENGLSWFIMLAVSVYYFKKTKGH